jgi:hypothetical protein
VRTLVSGLKERLREAGRIEYERLLTAAHAVIVVTAESAVLAEQVKKFDGGGKLAHELREWKPSSGAAALAAVRWPHGART